MVLIFCRIKTAAETARVITDRWNDFDESCDGRRRFPARFITTIDETSKHRLHHILEIKDYVGSNVQELCGLIGQCNGSDEECAAG